jgi:hypothetical protein
MWLLRQADGLFEEARLAPHVRQNWFLTLRNVTLIPSCSFGRRLAFVARLPPVVVLAERGHVHGAAGALLFLLACLNVCAISGVAVTARHICQLHKMYLCVELLNDQRASQH